MTGQVGEQYVEEGGSWRPVWIAAVALAVFAVLDLVLPGGESTTIVKLARIFDLLERLRDRVKAGMPAFGT